jgi:hypothetical protein
MVVVVVGVWVTVVVVITVVEVVSWTVVVGSTVGGVVAGTHDERLTATGKIASTRITLSSQDCVIRYTSPESCLKPSNRVSRDPVLDEK